MRQLLKIQVKLSKEEKSKKDLKPFPMESEMSFSKNIVSLDWVVGNIENVFSYFDYRIILFSVGQNSLTQRFQKDSIIF